MASKVDSSSDYTDQIMTEENKPTDEGTMGIPTPEIDRMAEEENREPGPTSLLVDKLCLFYGDQQALTDIDMRIPQKEVTAFIGPSGCGKSTLLRCFNRMNDLIDDVTVTGHVHLDGHDIFAPEVDVAQLRRRVGMVFQRPNPFPKSIYENVAYGLRIQGAPPKAEMDEIVEWALRSAALWDEVKDRLKESALGLSGGQQQRLVIARAGSGKAVSFAAGRTGIGTGSDLNFED